SSDFGLAICDFGLKGVGPWRRCAPVPNPKSKIQNPKSNGRPLTLRPRLSPGLPFSVRATGGYRNDRGTAIRRKVENGAVWQESGKAAGAPISNGSAKSAGSRRQPYSLLRPARISPKSLSRSKVKEAPGVSRGEEIAPRRPGCVQC